MKIIDVKFVSLEFGFGHKDRIDAEIFKNVDNQGEVSEIKHSVQLQEVALKDILSDAKIAGLTIGESLGSAIGLIRRLVALKAAQDLQFELATPDYIPPVPLRTNVEKLEDRQDAAEQAILQIMMEGMV